MREAVRAVGCEAAGQAALCGAGGGWGVPEGGAGGMREGCRGNGGKGTEGMVQGDWKHGGEAVVV